MLRNIIPALIGLTLLQALPLAPSASAQGVAKYFERNHHEGFVLNTEHLQWKPATGIINNDQTWYRIWNTWTREAPPKCNFESNIVLVATASGRNQPMYVFEWDETAGKKNLQYRLAHTKREGPGFTFSMIRLPRAATATINGTPVPPPPRVPVRHLDIPLQHPSYMFSNSFVLKSSAEVDLYCTASSGEWGTSSEEIKKVLRATSVDFNDEQIVVLVVPQPDLQDDIVFGEPNETEHRLEIPVTSPPANTNRTMLSRARGYIIPKVPGKQVYWTHNNDLRVLRTASGDLAARTVASIRRLRLRLQSPDPGEAVAAAREISRLGPPAHPAVPQLIDNLSHENHAVQTASADALRALAHFLIPHKATFQAMREGNVGNHYARQWSKMMLEHIDFYEKNTFWKAKE